MKNNSYIYYIIILISDNFKSITTFKNAVKQKETSDTTMESCSNKNSEKSILSVENVSLKYMLIVILIILIYIVLNDNLIKIIFSSEKNLLNQHIMDISIILNCITINIFKNENIDQFEPLVYISMNQPKMFSLLTENSDSYQVIFFLNIYLI